jgi:peptide/nickel transport system permease protein
MTDTVTTGPDTATQAAVPARGSSAGSAWAKWFARRLGLAVLTLWLCSVLVYFATAALGDPVRAILGKDYASSPERVAALEAELHLDQPVISRYLEWLGGLLTGNLGTSISNVSWSATGSSTPRCWCWSRPS